MVSTVLMKDSSDRTAFQVLAPGATAALHGLPGAHNVLLPDPSSLVCLPWVRVKRACLKRAAAWRPAMRVTRSVMSAPSGWPACCITRAA